MASKRKSSIGEVSTDKKKRDVVQKKKSKATTKRKPDSEASESDSEAKKIASKKRKAVQRIETDSEGEKSSEESDSETSSKSSWSKGKKIPSDKNEESTEKVRLVACKVCKKGFKLYAALVRHQKVHNLLNFKCVLCGETFEYRTAYCNHMKREHAEVDMFPCGIPNCEKSYHTQKKLRDHEKAHYKYMCRFCKRGFESKRMREKHVETIHF